MDAIAKSLKDAVRNDAEGSDEEGGGHNAHELDPTIDPLFIQVEGKKQGLRNRFEDDKSDSCDNQAINIAPLRRDKGAFLVLVAIIEGHNRKHRIH